MAKLMSPGIPDPKVCRMSDLQMVDFEPEERVLQMRSSLDMSTTSCLYKPFLVVGSIEDEVVEATIQAYRCVVPVGKLINRLKRCYDSYVMLSAYMASLNGELKFVEEKKIASSENVGFEKAGYVVSVEVHNQRIAKFRIKCSKKKHSNQIVALRMLALLCTPLYEDLKLRFHQKVEKWEKSKGEKIWFDWGAFENENKKLYFLNTAQTNSNQINGHRFSSKNLILARKPRMCSAPARIGKKTRSNSEAKKLKTSSGATLLLEDIKTISRVIGLYTRRSLLTGLALVYYCSNKLTSSKSTEIRLKDSSTMLYIEGRLLASWPTHEISERDAINKIIGYVCAKL